MNTNDRCPDESRVSEMLASELSAEQETQLAAHLRACPKCRTRLDELARQDTLLTDAARQLVAEQAPPEEPLVRAMNELRVRGPVEAGKIAEASVETGETPTSSGSEISLDFLSPTDHPQALGRLATYEILGVVGAGGMGIVFKAHDPSLNRIVAIKVLKPELAANAMAKQRFRAEAQAAAAITHDHVVRIHAVGEANHLPYIVMEYIVGVSLEDRIRQIGPLQTAEILRIGMQAASGLAAAHAQGLVHRDVKPSNILLENGVEQVKLVDFGLARADEDLEITQSGVVAGTPEYMSPEQTRARHVGHRSDLFSLGSVLYAMCTGRSPFRGETTVASLRRVCDETPRRILEINPKIPEWLAAIVDRLLEKEPNERFQTAAEVADLLSRYLAHLQNPQFSPQPSPVISAKPEPPVLAVRRRPWMVVAAVLVAVLGLTTLSEATGVTNVVATLIRITRGEGTLVIEVDDPTVRVALDGEQLTIAGVGFQELKLRPGQYELQATKGRQPVKQELVTITRGARQVVRVLCESGRATLEMAAESAVARPVVPWDLILPAGSPPPAIAPFGAAKTKEHQAAWAKYLGVRVEMENSIGMRFVLIPPGEFDMGSADKEVKTLVKQWEDQEEWMLNLIRSEGPQHRVRITKPFYLGEFEVTVGQFRQFVNARSYRSEAERNGVGGEILDPKKGTLVTGPEYNWRTPGIPQTDHHPVIQVSWNDAIEFCDWISEQEGRTCRLPTEAEWEYACRAGTVTFFSFPSELVPQFANTQDKSYKREFGLQIGGTDYYDDGFPHTAPIGSLGANAFRLKDMHGNVYEWCADEWALEFYQRSPRDDPLGRSPDSHEHTIRGGAWGGDAKQHRSAFRARMAAHKCCDQVGFRVVLECSANE